jgi:predicted exporter
VALGSDDEEALQTNDAIHKRLLRAKREGLLEDFRSLHVFVSSTALQERNQLELSRVPDLASRTLAALSLEGFRPQAFGSFTRALEESRPPPLRIEDLTRSALADLIIPFRLTLTRPEGESVALLTFLKGVRNAEALKVALGDIAGARFFDQRAFLGNLYREYRERTSLAIGFGLIAVTLLLAFRYRDPRVALATSLPAALAAATTIGLLSLFGVKVNLIHLLGLLLVLSVGVDYSIFLVSARDHREETPATLLSLCIACTSTCLAFGLLSLSSFPALRALGLVTGIGVLLSLLFAPLVLAGLGRGKENQ